MAYSWRNESKSPGHLSAPQRVKSMRLLNDLNAESKNQIDQKKSEEMKMNMPFSNECHQPNSKALSLSSVNQLIQPEYF